MRAHLALWKFAETDGSIFAKEYARARRALDDIRRVSSDTKWLCSRGGLALRKVWLALPESTQRELMLKTPDFTYPFSTSAVYDERSTKTKRRAVSPNATRNPKRIRLSTTKNPAGGADSENLNSGCTDVPVASFPESDTLTKKFHLARARYFDVLTKEELVRMTIAYNKGSFSGVLEAIMKSVEGAVHLAKYKDESNTSTDAFEVVASRLVDVFATIRGTTQESPDPTYDGPSEAFAADRISHALSTFQHATSNLTDDLRESCGADAPLFPQKYPWFGNPLATNKNRE